MIFLCSIWKFVANNVSIKKSQTDRALLWLKLKILTQLLE